MPKQDIQVIEAKHIIRISRGPQFGNKVRPALAMLSLAAFILSVYYVIIARYLFSIILLLAGIVIFSFVLNIHGIEVDTCRHMIRNYMKFLWLRIGKWKRIDDFNSIYLMQENVIIPTSDSEWSSDTYHYYYIKLVDTLNKSEIVLAEYKNYHIAQRISQQIANAAGLEFKDFLKRSIKER